MLFPCVLQNYHQKGWIRDSSRKHTRAGKLSKLLYDASTIQFLDGTFLLKEEFECRHPFGMYRPYEGYILLSAGNVRLFERYASDRCRDGCFRLSTRTEDAQSATVDLILELKSIRRGIHAYLSTPTIWGDCPTDLCGPAQIKIEVKDILMDVRSDEFCHQEGKTSICALQMSHAKTHISYQNFDSQNDFATTHARLESCTTNN